MLRKILLACGILSSLLYVSRDVAAMYTYPGYDFFSQVISEQSAIGAPGREINLTMGLAYSLLVVAFGIGLWLSAEKRRGLNVAGGLLVAAAIYGSFWPPMHMRGSTGGLTDTLHIVWTAGWLLLTIAAMGFAAAALGKRFTYYTLATVGAILSFGALTGVEGVHLAAHAPTPNAGVYERLDIGAFLLWIVVVAVEAWPNRRSSGRTGA